MVNLKRYANAIIVAFECKKRIRAIPLKSKEWKIVFSYINDYQNNKKLGFIDTIKILNEYEKEHQHQHKFLKN